MPRKTRKSPTAICRQGDVLIIPVSALPASVTARKRTRRGIVLAEGEVTGHAHTIADKDVVHFDAPNAAAAAAQLLASVGLKVELGQEHAPTFLEVPTGATIRHEEHAPIDLAPGAYVVVRQREWSDSDEPIQVAD